MEGLPSGALVIEVVAESGEALAHVAQELEAGEHRLVRVELRHSSRFLRLVDGRVEPLGLMRTQITLPGAQAGWLLSRLTDTDGKLDLEALEVDRVVLSFRPSSTALVLGLSIELEFEGTTEVVVETPATVSAQLLELGKPCAGVQVKYAHASFPVQILNPSYTSDAAGFARGHDMPEGEYLLSLGDSPYWQESYSVVARAWMEPVQLELHSRGGLILEARSKEGLPLAGVTLKIEHDRFGSDLAGWVASRGVRTSSVEFATDGAGRLELSGLPRGES